MSVVGGSDITYRNNTVSSSAGAAIYVGSEAAPNNTQGVRNITIDHIGVYRANWDRAIAQGAVLVHAGNPGTGVSQVTISDVAVHSQFLWAARAFSQVCDGSDVASVTYARDTSSQVGATPYWSNCR